MNRFIVPFMAVLGLVIGGLIALALCAYGQQGATGIPGTVLPGDVAVTAVMRPGEVKITAPAGRVKLETDELTGVSMITINTKAPGK